MAKYRPIVFDYIGQGRVSALDAQLLAIRENPDRVPQRPTPSNPLGNSIAGSKVRSGIRGGKFEPSATSGMLST